jgi:transposase
MPRESPYRVVLSDDERKRLEQTAREYTSPYYAVVRAKIALYAAEGLENRQIGQRLDLPRQIVSKWRKRFFEKRLDGLEDEARRGRPAVFSPSSRRRREGAGM